MEAIIGKLIDQLNSSVFVLLAILVVIGWGIHKISYLIGVWSTKFKHHDDKIVKVEGLADKVVKMETKIDLIYENTLGPRRTVAAHSPIGLTDVGREIAEKIQAQTILGKYASRLTKEVEAESPKNAYDIQMASMKVVKGQMVTMLNEPELATVKQEAYNRGLLVEDIMAVFGVLLRDRVLSLKGLPISDVDKHAPAEQKP
ncbi:MAG: hypothetical protein M0Z48_05955 [Nitrospiraceae bacterium]|nr:hypothetical protein [Nitrospiraceae bacterium]